MERRARNGAGARDISRILRDLGLDENYIYICHKKSLLNIRFKFNYTLIKLKNQVLPDNADFFGCIFFAKSKT
jgi:hypothetical protein